MSKILKQRIAGELRGRYRDMRDCVLLKFEGLDVRNAVALRTHLRRSGVRLNVVPNRLTRMVLKGLEFDVEGDLFSGPTALAWGGEDAVAAPKAVAEWIRTTRSRAVEIQGGYLDRSPLGARAMKEVANLPPRPVLLGMVLGAVTSPLREFLWALTSHQREFVGLLEALIEKRGGDAPASESGGRPEEGPAG